MAPFSYIFLAIFCTITISVCGGIPRLNISRHVHKENVLTFQRAEDATAKKDTKSNLMTVLSTLSNAEKVNLVVRSKRSTCEMPANLPQTVQELKTQLNASQFVGLNPDKSTPPKKTTDKIYTCPNSTSESWWPQTGDNLKSTCPWTNKLIDLGEHAFPRYFNNAMCICQDCLGLPYMRCKEVKHNVTYLIRTGCENDLAVMNIVQKEINVGCYCAAPGPNASGVTDKNDG